MQIIIGSIFIIAILIQTTLLNYLAIAGVKPDLLLIIVVYISVKKGSLSGEIWGFLSGFLEDVFGGALMGMNALSKTIIGNIIGYFRNRLDFENIITQILLTSLATLVSVTVVSLIKIIFYVPVGSFLGIIKYSIIASFYNGVLSILIFRLMDRVKIARE